MPKNIAPLRAHLYIQPLAAALQVSCSAAASGLWGGAITLPCCHHFAVLPHFFCSIAAPFLQYHCTAFAVLLQYLCSTTAIALQCHCKRDAESLQYGEADKQDTRTYAYKETPHPYIVDDASGRKSVYGSAG